ncbi:MAG: polymer-forming cytoskeletal protein [Thermodesulfobacteriota bacterium]|nr:polymer-forming cytoskeletal protein [Thermodesulfobacteriota bacterium]
MGKKNRMNLSIIDKDLKIDGSIVSRGKLIIKGSIKGAMEGEIVIIAQEGKVHSDAKVSSMTIGGQFKGDICASKELIILSTGSCSGKVQCKDLIVENGGILNAEVSCKTSQKQVKAEEKKTNQENGKKIEL